MPAAGRARFLRVLQGVQGADRRLLLRQRHAVRERRVRRRAHARGRTRRRADSARSLREAVDTAGRVEVGRIARRFAALAIIAQTAPLLGLLGTFLGAIQTVNALNVAGPVVRGDLLAGFMQALVPAAAGLLVGIPAQVMYGVLRVRFERLVIELEAAASQIVGYLAAQKEKAR